MKKDDQNFVPGTYAKLEQPLAGQILWMQHKRITELEQELEDLHLIVEALQSWTKTELPLPTMASKYSDDPCPRCIKGGVCRTPAVDLLDGDVHVKQISEALRLRGLTLVKTTTGYVVMDLGTVTAHQTERAVHMTHCNQGEYIDCCKYGDDHCPCVG